MTKTILTWLLTTILLTASSFAEAQQQEKLPRIGFLSTAAHSSLSSRLEAFRQGLRELGFIEGKNIAIEYRSAEGKPNRLPELAAELVRLKVDCIVTAGDPKLSRAAVFSYPRSEATDLKETEAAAQLLKVQLISLEVQNLDDLENAFRSSTKSRADAIVIGASGFFNTHQSRIVELAAKHRLPGMYIEQEFVLAGGLMTYATSIPDLYRRAATYVDKILKGAKPGDLPVEQPTKFELIINLKAAKQIGLTIPPNVLARADKVIK